MNEGIHLDLDTWIVPGQIRDLEPEQYGNTSIYVVSIICYIMSAPYAAVANYTHNKHATLVLTHTLSLSLLLVCVAA